MGKGQLPTKVRKHEREQSKKERKADKFKKRVKVKQSFPSAYGKVK